MSGDDEKPSCQRRIELLREWSRYAREESLATTRFLEGSLTGEEILKAAEQSDRARKAYVSHREKHGC